MKFHIVGGFLGSGKTTAIIMAARDLMSKGKTVGVITNDQGKYLVDTAFFKLDDIPTVEVTGGCFCCNYSDLDSRLNQLIEIAHPDVIFAEPVGSCANIVATVLKPLMELRALDLTMQSLSVLSDIRLLQMRLQDEPLPFSDNVIYIYDKQIEEAHILIINKKDLISQQEGNEILTLARHNFPEKKIILQNSQEPDDITAWLDLLEENQLPNNASTLKLDYTRHGDGVARLAWLDGSVHMSIPEGQGKKFIEQLIEKIISISKQNNNSIGHVKFLITGALQEIKISITTIEDINWKKNIPFLNGREFDILVNARVEMKADLLKTQIQKIPQEIRDANVKILISDLNCLHPAFPDPTFRIL